MALIPCPHCGKQISDKAYNCPKCGYDLTSHPKEIKEESANKAETPKLEGPVSKNNKTKSILIVSIVALVIVIGILVSFFLTDIIEIKTDSNQPVYSEKLLSKAKNGDAKSQYELGWCYLKGYGIEKDFDKAVYWFQEGIEQDYAEAYRGLGVCYMFGDGVPQDFAKAINLYEEAASRGDARAMYNLGSCYFYGMAVLQNYNDAFMWYEKSLKHGEEEAKYQMGWMYIGGKGVQQDIDKGIKMLEEGVKKDNHIAELYMGVCYLYGTGKPKNNENGIELLKKSAEKENDIAMCLLGQIYQEGKFATQNDEKAIEWYKKSAELGNEDAKQALYNYQNIIVETIEEEIKPDSISVQTEPIDKSQLNVDEADYYYISDDEGTSYILILFQDKNNTVFLWDEYCNHITEGRWNLMMKPKDDICIVLEYEKGQNWASIKGSTRNASLRQIYLSQDGYLYLQQPRGKGKVDNRIKYDKRDYLPE